MGATRGKLPEYTREHFDNQQLAMSLVQLRFPPLPRFGDQQVLTDVKAALSDEYPLNSQAMTMGVVVTPQGISQTPSGTAWRFSSIDRIWTVELSDSAVSLETRQYGEQEDFAQRFTEVLSIISQHLKPQYQLRLGLRYINEFRHPDATSYTDWIDLLNPELLGLGARGILGGTIEQTIGEVRTKRDDGRLLVRHGFLQGTTVTPVEGQVPKSGPFYLLDLDYYDEDAKRFRVEGVGAQIERYNDVLYRVFRWSIGDGRLYRYLRGDA